MDRIVECAWCGTDNEIEGLDITQVDAFTHEADCKICENTFYFSQFFRWNKPVFQRVGRKTKDSKCPPLKSPRARSAG